MVTCSKYPIVLLPSVYFIEDKYTEKNVDQMVIIA